MTIRNPLSNLSKPQIETLIHLFDMGFLFDFQVNKHTARFLVNTNCIEIWEDGYVLTEKGEYYARIAISKRKDAQP